MRETDKNSYQAMIFSLLRLKCQRRVGNFGLVCRSNNVGSLTGLKLLD
jgi:hypothetical protein